MSSSEGGSVLRALQAKISVLTPSMLHWNLLHCISNVCGAAAMDPPSPNKL